MLLAEIGHSPGQNQLPGHNQLLEGAGVAMGAALWPDGRIALAEALWGEGFLLPGGESEILRLVRPLGLSGDASLLLVGAGTGGPACAIARRLGVWVSGFEADPALAAIAAGRAGTAGLGRRVQIKRWDPGEPAFGAGACHHGLALEPLRGAGNGAVLAEPVLAAIGGALKPGGQLVLLETVADLPLPEGDGEAAVWARMENRRLDLPSEASVTRMLGRLGFDVRGVEDLSERHAHLAVLGWRGAMRRLGTERPGPMQAGLLAGEADRWSRRLDLLRAGRLRLLRWHAVRKPGMPVSGHPERRAG